MKTAGERICPRCTQLIPSGSVVCTECGIDLKYGSYKIISHGLQWAIEYKGEIRIDSLTLDGALNIADVLNYYGNL